jgi:long-chain acyl-CoA synthetase
MTCAYTAAVPAPDGANVADLVRRSAAEYGERVALRHVTPGGSETTTWSQLDRDVDAAAAGIRSELGVRAGDRVALSLTNGPSFVTAYFGLLRAGAVAVPLNTTYTAPEVARLLHEADASVVLCDDASLAVVEEAVAGTHRVQVDPAGLDALVAAGRTAGPQDAVGSGEDLAVLLFTSGTSGRPRGAMLSHRALLANVDQCSRLEPAPMTEQDVVLLVLPLFHIYGLNAGLGMVAATGACGLLVERFDPVGTLRLVAEHGVTNIPGAPPMWLAWSRQDGAADALRGVRLMASGAAPLPPEVIAAIRDRTGHTVQEGYGLTEAAPVVATTLASPRAKAGSVGRAIPGVEVALRDPHGADVSDSDTGEVWVRGDNLFSGYWPDGADGPGADGWWPTGDVAYADGDGDLFLVDRRKELVLVSGFNVYPREVEEVLAEHPDVAEAAVIAMPDPLTGEAVKAFVVPRPGATLTEEDVAAHAAARLARFKRPAVVVVVDELPHSVTGKVAKGRLRDGELL